MKLSPTLSDFVVPTPQSLLERVMRAATTPLVVAGAEQDDESHLPKVEALVEYQERPEDFIVEVLGVPRHTIRWSLNPGYSDENGVAIHTWDGTPDPIIAILQGLVDWKDVAVESATGTGKSFIAACIILWFLATWAGSRIWTFAPKEEQLSAYMWAEIGKVWGRFKRRFPTAELTDLRIRMRGPRDDTWGARGVAVGVKAGEESSVKAQGMHAPHMLLIYEEMPGIPPSTTAAGSHTSTAPHNLRLGLGNPDHQLDALHLMGYTELGEPRQHVRNIRISAYDHPNIVSRDATIVHGAVSIKSIEKRKEDYGGGEKAEAHRLFKSRVQGISPAEARDSLIKLEWVQAAQKLYDDENAKRVLTANGTAKKALGVDVANSESGDEAAISYWEGAFCHKVDAFPCVNGTDLGTVVWKKMEAGGYLDEFVGIDSMGNGATAVNELRKRDRWIRALGSHSDNQQYQHYHRDGEDEEYDTQRAQMWWWLARDLQNGSIALPPNRKLAMQLTTVQWEPRNGKIWVETKRDLKKRGVASPNEADAVVYGNWVRDRSPILSVLPKKHSTQLERIQKELKDLDKKDHRLRREEEGEDYVPPANKYGGVIRQ